MGLMKRPSGRLSAKLRIEFVRKDADRAKREMDFAIMMLEPLNVPVSDVGEDW
jgi:hypothetical protein